ncbi:CPBP family intramembrane glutamic endopeptidase [Rufibacter aurantiacus]|uniref:CPBP family intramembrane glutamic endopeptidase n=1 Tax=Rufibacter aurantiacus TaxID=2817374 RepID=UPI001B309DF1|nr:type II CAAX endopeptidase family protein [Rufibacter aurantiacus]
MPLVQTTPPSFTRAHSWLAIVAGYLALALTYHAAEYAMRFHQHIPLFLGLMLAVVPVAYLVARLQGFRGLRAWGMQFNQKYALLLLLGLALGLLVNGLAFALRLWMGIEVVTFVPDFSTLVTQTLIFAAGTFLPSLAEDILTRGYLFGHLQGRLSRWGFVLVSSAVYVLNHLYSLDDGFAALAYLFALGIMLAIPLVYTKNLWYSVGAHWAGNIVYRLGQDVLTVKEGPSTFSGLWELTIFVLLFAVVNYWVGRRISKASRLR